MIIRDAVFSIPFFILHFWFYHKAYKGYHKTHQCKCVHSVLSVNFVPLVVKKFSTLLMDYNVPLITLLTPSLKRILLKLMSIPGLGTPDKRFQQTGTKGFVYF